MWTLFEELEREVERLPNMSIVVGCRDFDLEHDYRISKLKTQGQGFEVVKLGGLSVGQIDSSLSDAETDPSRVQPGLKPILTVPLHLALFLRLTPQLRADVHNRDELFGAFWEETERKVEHRLGRKVRWAETIDRLSDWLSVNQELSAPQHILDDFSIDASAMASEHFLVLTENRSRFFHEALFDYAFARRFSVRGGQLVDLLSADEQHLFRRAQVRQVLTFLRLHDRRRYLRELEAVLGHCKIRFHVKKLVLQWLSSLVDPQVDELEVLQRVVPSAAGLHDDVQSVVAGQPSWFDVLDQA